jgi:hypothetical protein
MRTALSTFHEKLVDHFTLPVHDVNLALRPTCHVRNNCISINNVYTTKAALTQPHTTSYYLAIFGVQPYLDQEKPITFLCMYKLAEIAI